MKKLFLKVFMLACVLGMSTNVAWADCHENTADPAEWFYVQMNAKISSTPCTTTSPGQLKVSFIKQNGDLYDLTDSYDKWQLWILRKPKPANPYAGDTDGVNKEDKWGERGFCAGINDAKAGKEEPDYPDYFYQDYNKEAGALINGDEYAVEGYDSAFYWYKNGYHLMDANPTAFGTTASMNGYTKLYAPGIDMGPLGGLASTYVYFNAIVTENPGWYFVGWSYMDGGTDITGTVTTDLENEQNNIFEILPSSKNGIANIRKQDVYATFQPVLVADYKVAGMIPGANETTTVTFDYVGERVDATDFDITIADEEGTPSKFEQVGDADFSVAGKVAITVRYTGTATGEHRGSVTLASKSGCSSLTAPVFARVPSDATIEATLYDGQTPTATTGSLTDMINAAHNTDYIVTLNKNYGTALTVDKVVKMDLNGYQVTNTLTVANGGELTLNFSKYGGKLINNIVVENDGKLILNGTEITGAVTVNAGGELVQNGATITGAVTNNGTFTATEGKLTNGLTSAGTLTINGGSFEGITAIAVTAGAATINKGTISGTTYGIQTSGSSNTTITSKLVSVYGGTNAIKCDAGSVTLQNGRFDGAAAPLSGTMTLESGFFKTTTIGIDMPEGKKQLNVLAGNEFNEGYRYFIGTDESAKNSGVGVCRIGTTPYTTLEDALSYANNNSNKEVVIFMLNDYVLSSGYYTLPAKAKLIVPMSNDQETDNPIISRVSNSSAHRVDYVQPTEFRRLTFAKGVNMEVFGLIELTCAQRASDDAYAAMPHGNYGHLVMQEGSRMVLQNGAELRAWGYMTGKGETDARRGSTVREQFQMGDWKGGSNSFNMINPDMDGGNPNLSYFHIFPISQYFIQNVESPVKYHPGAVLSTTTSVAATFNESGTVGITAAANDIPVVGVSGQHTAMFLMDIAADAENTWVRKWYDAEHDVQTYEVNSGAHIGSMVLNLGSLGSWNIVMNSGQFVLPIMNNMKIHLLSGEMDFTQSTSLLPGAEVEIDKESTVSITNSSDPAIVSGSLYVYDAAQWIKPVWGKFGDQPALPGAGGLSYKNTVVVKYSPSWGGKPTVRDEHGTLESASINVHGTFDAKQGFVFTTENGANIHSTNEDAGTFIYTNPAPANEYVFYINPIEGAGQEFGGLIFGQEVTSAQLKNGDNSYTQTTGAGEHQSFIYMDNEWKTSESEYIQLLYFDCFTAEANMMTYVLHVTNEDYVKQIAMAEAPVRIREYLIADAFAKANGFEGGIAPREYEYFRSTYYSLVAAQGKDAGEAAMTYAMQNSGDPNQIAAAGLVPLIPGFKEQAESYSGTYDLGDAVQKIYIKPQEWLEIVGQAHIQLGLDAETIEGFETTYTTTSGLALDQVVEDYLDYITDNLQNPYLVGVDGNTDHTYSDAAGAGRLFILMTNEFGDCDQWWEVEKKNNLYHCIHSNNDTYYYYDEDDEIWKEQMFSVSWKNWNGDIIQTAAFNGELVDEYYVKYGTMAEFLGSNPTREQNIDYTYDFTGWTPALGPVTSDVTYTATFTEKPRMYTIIFQQEGGVEIERHFLTHNEVPVCENVPTKVGHTLQWSPAIAAVTGDATYTATWLENPPTEYAVTFYDYNGTTKLKPTGEDPYMVPVGEMPTPPADPTGKPATSEFTYVFDHWSPALEAVSATSIKSYTAVYREVAREYTISYFKEDGVTPNTTKASESLPYGATPTPPAVTKENPETGHTYTLVWKTLNEGGTIQTVTGAASYKPTYIDVLNKYTVTVKSNPSGACSSMGAGLYDYNTSATITLSVNDGYTFTGWSDGYDDDDNPETTPPTSRNINVTEDKELVANFTVADPDYTIRWHEEDGTLIYSMGQKANTATVFTGAIPTKEDPNGQYAFTFYGWTTVKDGTDSIKNGLTPKATAHADYYAFFTKEPRKYTISWKNEAGTADIEVDYEQPYGATIEYNSATPTKNADAAATYTFNGWSATQGGDVVEVPATVTRDANYYAHFAATPKEYLITLVRDDGSLISQSMVAYGETPVAPANPTKPETSQYTYEFTDWTPNIVSVTGNATYTANFDAVAKVNIELGVSGSLDLNSESTTKHDLIITSNGVNSAELKGADYLTLTGDAIFRMEKYFAAQTWYAVAVPWTVALSGIRDNSGNAFAAGNVYVLEFDANAYASADRENGRNDYWHFLDQSGNDMQPGKLYMIWFRNAQTAVEFHKTSGSIWNTTTSVTTTTGSGDQANWNGIANPALYHADLSTGATDVLKYNGNDAYVVASSTNMIVGQPIFVQVSDPNTVLAAPVGGSSPAPYRRAPQEETTDNRFVVELTLAGNLADRLIVQTAEEKANEYVIGKDLAKMSVSAQSAQMWINRYDTKLCKNTVALQGEQVEYPLNISAPVAGGYVLSAKQERGDATIYLTYNGEAIWNLSESAYVASLNKGTDANYGLRISAKAPHVTTGMDEAILDAQGETMKVLINNQVFIIRGEKVYSIDGQLVK